MKYKEYKPSKKIEKLIDSYWLFSNLNLNENQRILPDGCADIIFNLGESTGSIPKETIAISGMMTKFSDETIDKNSELLGVRFKTGQLSNFTKHPLFEIKNKIINASEIIPELNLETIEQLAKEKDVENKIIFVEELLLKILDTKRTVYDPLTTSVADFILTSSKKISINKIAENHYISLRQLERRFKNNIGVTLKEFINIVRFNQTIKSIANNSDKSLLHIAFDNGYYDHSHLTNEIKRFSGQIPSDFR